MTRHQQTTFPGQIKPNSQTRATAERAFQGIFHSPFLLSLLHRALIEVQRIDPAQIGAKDSTENPIFRQLRIKL